MQVVKVNTDNGIDDIKFIAENDADRLFIKQLAESGTLSCLSREVSDTIYFRPISVTPDLSNYISTKGSIGKYDFNVRQNQNFNVDLTFKSDGVALDLSQFTAIKLQVKLRKQSVPILELAISTGLTISGVLHNILLVAMTKDQTAKLSCDTYYYDILMSKPNSNVYYLEGKITSKNTVTK